MSERSNASELEIGAAITKLSFAKELFEKGQAVGVDGHLAREATLFNAMENLVDILANKKDAVEVLLDVSQRPSNYDTKK